MSITSYCNECQQQTVNGVLIHTSTCSANNFIPKFGTELVPPSTVIKFESKAEQDKWLEQIKNGAGTNAKP